MAFTKMFLTVSDKQAAEAVVSVGPDLDSLGCVRVFTPSAESKACFGAIDFTVTADFAKALGAAIIRVAEDIEKAAK